MRGLSEVAAEVDQQPWMTEGVCAQTDPEAFFPEPGAPAHEAKSVCRGCPVLDQCREYALSLPYVEDFGVWGGLSRVERRHLRRRRARAQEAAAA